MTTAMDNIVKNYRKSKRKLSDDVDTALREAIQGVFDENPALDFIQWLQFTQYFNDGDPCNFYVREEWGVEIGVDGESYNTDDEYEGFDDPMVKEVFDAGYDVISTFACVPDIAKSAFGDHARVTLRRGEDGKVKASTDDFTDHD